MAARHWQFRKMNLHRIIEESSEIGPMEFIDLARVHAEHREPCTENHFVFAGNTEVIRLASGEP
jgi:hypothetical protein